MSLLVTLASSSKDAQLAEWNAITMEIFYYIFSGVEPEELMPGVVSSTVRTFMHCSIIQIHRTTVLYLDRLLTHSFNGLLFYRAQSGTQNWKSCCRRRRGRSKPSRQLEGNDMIALVQQEKPVSRFVSLIFWSPFAGKIWQIEHYTNSPS